jgi:hypothetical protein
VTRRKGPALIYITSVGDHVDVDTEAVADPRERALYRALSGRARQLADAADEAEHPDAGGTGFYA